MSNKKEAKGKIYGGIWGHIIFVLIMLAGICMVYFGLTVPNEKSYYMVVAGAMMFFLSLMFLLPKSVPAPWIHIVAGCMLICLGILHIAVCFMALLGLWLVVYNIFALAGKKDLQNKMDTKTQKFFFKLFKRPLEQAGVLAPEDSNEAMGITVIDKTKKKRKSPKQEELAFPYQDSVPEESTAEEPITPPSVPKATFFVTLIAGIMFFMSGLSHFLMDLRFASYSSMQMNFMSFGFSGIFLTIGLVLIIVSIVGFAKNRKSSR